MSTKVKKLLVLAQNFERLASESLVSEAKKKEKKKLEKKKLNPKSKVKNDMSSKKKEKKSSLVSELVSFAEEINIKFAQNELDKTSQELIPFDQYPADLVASIRDIAQQAQNIDDPQLGRYTKQLAANLNSALREGTNVNNDFVGTQLQLLINPFNAVGNAAMGQKTRDAYNKVTLLKGQQPTTRDPGGSVPGRGGDGTGAGGTGTEGAGGTGTGGTTGGRAKPSGQSFGKIDPYIQKALKYLGYQHLLGTSGQGKDGVDGSFGPATRKAIEQFKKDYMPEASMKGKVSDTDAFEAIKSEFRQKFPNMQVQYNDPSYSEKPVGAGVQPPPVSEQIEGKPKNPWDPGF